MKYFGLDYLRFYSLWGVLTSNWNILYFSLWKPEYLFGNCFIHVCVDHQILWLKKYRVGIENAIVQSG